MKLKQVVLLVLLAGLAVLLATSYGFTQSPAKPSGVHAQVPSWSQNDLNFFLHGSMSTEVVPEVVLRAFIKTYPDLFPKPDLSHLGLIPDPAFGWPVGFSRKKVSHLGGMSSVGVNCASCHVGEITPAGGGNPVRVLGMTSLFDAESYFGAVTVAGFRTADPANMQKFLLAYLVASDPSADSATRGKLASALQQQQDRIVAAMTADPFGAKGITAGGLYEIDGKELQLDRKAVAGGVDLARVSVGMLKLFHNMRASLHIPDQPPDKAPPASGPGRNDAFGLLSAALFGAPQPYAPVKYGLVWNVDQRHWVHWDGNTQSPLARNLLASLGLGAPLVGREGRLEFALVKRQTDLSQTIRPPRYPFAIDAAAAERGAATYRAQCASCHEGPETDARLHDVKEVGTDPLRARLFSKQQADRFDTFLAELKTAGYVPPKEPGIRSTQKYWAPSLAGVWARSPYLHNGSVRTMEELLTPPAQRGKSFHRGSKVYDEAHMGYADGGSYLMDTSAPGNTNVGHSYGTKLSQEQKRELMEYLKTK